LLSGGGTVTVGLYANTIGGPGPNAGASLPGSLLASLGTASAPGVPGIVSLNVPFLALFANTRYWIGLSSTNTSPVWEGTFDFSGTGVGSEFSFSAQNGVLPNNPDGEYQMRVTAAATPLPAALPLFAGGGGVLSLIAWRRRRKAQATA